MASAVTWFEIACSDFDRAKQFYETIFDAKLQDMPAPGQRMAAFPADWEKGEIGGTIVQREQSRPSSEGTLVYLNADPDLQVVLDRVVKAGGQVAMPKTQIPMEGSGFMAVFSDSEGNLVGLTSMG
ncbi:MAG TPA: VOC family protein [Chloroflexota bacterium]